ncbi:ankyrin repeat domain-containing protein SOWAHA [Paramisgurnus dabryanus]|uniref:ankyrin repeat domain-containing protein SOWAHA n=1 Tax=Paramisgurnus dabryanus TaxID=90735 RepID=UPI0031F45924
MELTQEAILNILIEGKGKVKNSELLGKYKEHLNSSDPEEKKKNRDLFKSFVNNLAVVKDFEETKYIVLKKVYHHLLEANTDQNTQREQKQQDDEDGSHSEEDKKEQQYVEDRRSDVRRSSSPVGPSFIEAALEKAKNVEFKPVKSLQFSVPLKSDDSDKHGAVFPVKKETNANKPYALPLRMPLVDVSHHNKKTATEHLETGQNPHSSPQCKRKPSTDGFVSTGGSPQLRRHFKTPKQAEEPKYSNHCPLDSLEHEWLVKSAAGQWSQVYGLLLKEAQLAEKKDFISGFTALHWAVKCGNIEMADAIIQRSSAVDIDAKSYGGYTPLHLAAIHDQLALIELLLKYDANKNVRDNCGKKPYHYLQEAVPKELKERLGEPKARCHEVVHVREEFDPYKHLKTPYRLFQNNPVHKKKSKTRVVSLAEDVRDEKSDPLLHKQRPISNLFY